MIGRCALCGEEKEMTFEHIPPKRCFNSHPVKPVSGDVLVNAMTSSKHKPWETKGLKYENMQRGFGRWTLCADCNSKTGTWYGEEYAKFTHSIHVLLKEQNLETNSWIEFEIFDAYPLRFMKQMISMICSINRELYFDERIRNLANFVIDKDAVGLDKQEYKIFMYLIQNSLVKQCPMTWLIKGITNNEKPIIDVVTELFAYPIGVVVCFSPRDDFEHFGVDITKLCDIGYMQQCNIKMRIPILESNIFIPCDYRSKEELIKTSSISDNNDDKN